MQEGASPPSLIGAAATWHGPEDNPVRSELLRHALPTNPSSTRPAAIIPKTAVTWVAVP